MKKMMFVLAFIGMSSLGFAQEVVPVQKYSVATNSFWSNWFVTVGGNHNSFYGDQEQGLGLSNSPFKDFRRDWGMGISIGKSFTPGLALRTKVSGIWGKSVQSQACKANSCMKKYFTVNEHMMFNLSNLLCGYRESRVWNVIPYIGAGVLRNCSSDVYALDVNAGLMQTWRICSKTEIFLDASVMQAESKADGMQVSHSKSLCHNNYDIIYSIEAGLKFNLGKSTWKKVPDVDALMEMNREQMDALTASLSDAQAENTRLKNLLAQQKSVAPVETNAKQVVVKVPARASVFFNINRSKIVSRKDLVDVVVLAKYAKDNNKKVVVTGYADSRTGNATYNQKLSQKRADVVANELVKMGITRDNIIVKADGGVDELSPAGYNRRAIVEIQ